MISKGKHLGRFLYAKSTELGGTPNIEIAFAVDGETVIWRGWTNKPENFVRTYETMIGALGFTGDDNVDEETGMFPDAAFTKREATIDVEPNEYMNKKGVQMKEMRVSWIHTGMGGQKARLKALGSDEALAIAKANMAAKGPIPEKDMPF